MGHGASSARRKAPAAPAAPANPREKRPSKIAGRPDHEAADGPPLTHAEAARLARSRTSAMLERILDDRRECEILEAFLHSEYRVELLYFLRSCDKFESLVRKFVSIETAAAPATGARCGHPQVLRRAGDIFDRFLAPAAPYAVRVASAKEVQLARLQLDSGAVSALVFHPAKRAVMVALGDPQLFKRFLAYVESPAATSEFRRPPARKSNLQPDFNVIVRDGWDARPMPRRRPRRDSRSTESDGAFELDEFGAPRQRASSSSSVDDFSGERRSSGHSASRDSDARGSPAPSKTDWGPAPRASHWLRRGSASPEAPPDEVAVRRGSAATSASSASSDVGDAPEAPDRRDPPGFVARGGASLPPLEPPGLQSAPHRPRRPSSPRDRRGSSPCSLDAVYEDPLDSPLPPGHRPVAEGRRKSETGLVADAGAIRRKSSFRLDAGDDDEFNRAYEDGLNALHDHLDTSEAQVGVNKTYQRHLASSLQAGVDEAGGSRVVRVSDPLITTDMVRRKSSLDALADAAAPAAADGEGF